MKKIRGKQIYNRLFIRLYCNYAAMLLVTAVLISLIFVNLYENSIMDRHRNQAQRQAESIANKMAEFIKYEKYDEFFQYHGILEDINDLDIWTISNPDANNPMDERMETTSVYEIANSETYAEIVESAFKDKTEYRISYDDYYEVPMITMAVPVIGTNREVAGAVLLMSEVEGQKDVVADSFSLIIVSSIVALAISFIIIIIFAKELSLPISRMRFTALELAAGNYNIKTEISRRDEIGDLAQTIDVLSEKLLENAKEREKLDQMRLDFFANVSHELRTPITVLRAYTETLVDGVVQEEEKKQQYYDRMLLECKSMERLVRDLLLLSKMQNPDFAIEKEPVNLLQVFEDMIRSARTIAKKKNIPINLEHEDTMYMILGDYDRLRQMFMVILDNAIKFSTENQTVHIKLSKKDKIIISIRDEGIGIPSEEIDSIFDKFYKSNLRQNEGGTGLGLAIARQIAGKHNGTIEVFSTVGVGTEFMFCFPIDEIDY